MIEDIKPNKYYGQKQFIRISNSNQIVKKLLNNKITNRFFNFFLYLIVYTDIFQTQFSNGKNGP